MEIKRDLYLKKLIERKQNGLIKVITGIRRCGKSYLLNTIFYNYLKEHPIIEIGETAKALSLSYNTVSAAIKKMLSLGILGEAETRSRGRGFLYTGYVEILKLGTYSALKNKSEKY